MVDELISELPPQLSEGARFVQQLVADAAKAAGLSP